MGKTYRTLGDEEHPVKSRIKEGDRGVGLGTAILKEQWESSSPTGKKLSKDLKD